MAQRKLVLLVLFIAIGSFGFGGLAGIYFPKIKHRLISVAKLWNEKTSWNDGFSLVQIQSSADGTLQHAYFLASHPGTLRPLVVSLHSWSGDYSQHDPLAEMAKNEGWNYIHPDFRGPNRSADACLSEKALADIDDAIQYAKDNGFVDTENIFVVGMSGGGYATLGAFLKTSHPIKAFLSWVPISDLSAWFHHSMNRDGGFAREILRCTSDGIVFDPEEARKRSPMFWDVPAEPNGRLEIYAGINDGYTASVPISHSILFFNRVVEHYGHPENKVGNGDIIKLLTRGIERNDSPGKIGDREVIYRKDTEPVSLVIFDGAHEMLPEYTFGRMQQIAD